MTKLFDPEEDEFTSFMKDYSKPSPVKIKQIIQVSNSKKLGKPSSMVTNK